MCLINFHLQDHPNYELIIAANRDEAYDRPTAPAHFWEDEPMILAGRDLKQMGTWFGITKTGRFAALTNYRDFNKPTNKRKLVSRGEIIHNFLAGSMKPEEYLQMIHEIKEQYDGFNVIVGNPHELYYYNNIAQEIKRIPTGTHSVSNHMLNTSWPKVINGKQRLKKYVLNQKKIDPNVLLDLLADNTEAKDNELPDTGIGLELERKLSPLFIKTEHYGTRSSTVLLIDKQQHVTFIERTYKNGIFQSDQTFAFHINL